MMVIMAHRPVIGYFPPLQLQVPKERFGRQKRYFISIFLFLASLEVTMHIWKWIAFLTFFIKIYRRRPSSSGDCPFTTTDMYDPSSREEDSITILQPEPSLPANHISKRRVGGGSIVKVFKKVWNKFPFWYNTHMCNRSTKVAGIAT